MKVKIIKIIKKMFYSNPYLGNSTEASLNGELNIVVLEYYNFIWNRVLLLNIKDNFLLGVKVNGPIISPLNKEEKYNNPNYYVNHETLLKYQTFDIVKNLKLDKANFCFTNSEIINVEYDISQKWGMGNIPYSGRIKIKLKNNITRELILLGFQDGQKIVKELRKKLNIKTHT